MIDHPGKHIVPYGQLEHGVEPGPRLTLSFQGQPFTGIARDVNKLGIIEADHAYFKGYTDGPSWFYNPDGSLLRVEGYFNEQPHGRWRYYDDAGFVYLEIDYHIRLKIRTVWHSPNHDPMESFPIQWNPTQKAEYQKRLLHAQETNRLIPAIDIPIEQAFSEWENAVNERIARGESW